MVVAAKLNVSFCASAMAEHLTAVTDQQLTQHWHFHHAYWIIWSVMLVQAMQ